LSSLRKQLFIQSSLRAFTPVHKAAPGLRLLITGVRGCLDISEKLRDTAAGDYIDSSFFGESILWHVNPLLGNDREINKYTTAVAK
jgi:hypothetical protein